MTTTWMYMPWRQVFDACVRWSQEHGHRHVIEKSLEPGAWRVTCLVDRDAEPGRVVLGVVAEHKAPTCDCYPFGLTPDSFEGPQEHCPVHGRDPEDPS